MRSSILFVIVFQFLVVKFYGQDPVFSQYYINSMHLNPAIAGSANDPRIFLHYRNQWPAIGNAFITYQGSYDQFIKPLNGGIGINMVRDNILGGALSSTNLDLIYSYRFKATTSLTMQAGLQASFNFINRNITTTGATLPIDFPVSQSTTQPDFGMGILGMTKNSQIGLSVNHLNSGYLRFNYNFIPSPLKISFFYTRKFKIYNKYKVKDNGFYVSPAILVQKQAESIMLNYGVGIRAGNLLAGMWMRTNLPFQFSAAIFSLGFAFDNVTIGYSYDYNMLSLDKVMPVTGAHEITLVAVLALDPKRGRYGPIKCPSSFVQ